LSGSQTDEVLTLLLLRLFEYSFSTHSGGRRRLAREICNTTAFSTQRLAHRITGLLVPPGLVEAQRPLHKQSPYPLDLAPSVTTRSYTYRLRQCDLRRSYLTRANLSEARLSGADLSGADLSRAVGITAEQLEQQSLSLEGAIMPEGLAHP
jgi:hypothetical protein